MVLAIFLMLRKIILLVGKRSNVGIEISSDYDLQFPCVIMVDFQHMGHECDELSIFFGLARAEV